MKPTICFALIAALVLICSPSFAQQNNKAEDLYQDGLMQMEGHGNYQKALEIFGQILREFAGDRRVAAKAQFQTGVCYEKLGKAEAQKAYEQTISKYPDQPDLVAQAQARLSALSSAIEMGRGPVARRLLTQNDIGDDDLLDDIYPSPDGQRVACASMNDGRVEVRDLASGTVDMILPGLPSFWHYSPRWSPDGTRIAVTEEDLTTKITSVKLFDLGTRKTTTVPGTASKTWKEPDAWSKDGRFIVIGTSLIAVDNGTVTTLPDSGRSGALSPDGRFLAYLVGDKTRAELYVQPINGGARQQIVAAEDGLADPVWAPDGKALAYWRESGIWVVPMSQGKASGPAKLALRTAHCRLWAWTEAGLFYTMWDVASVPRVLLQVSIDAIAARIPPDGVRELPGPHPKNPAGFAWSPDMHQIAYGIRDSRNVAVATIDPPSLVTYELGEKPIDYFPPAWSPDGQQVLVQSLRFHAGLPADSAVVLAIDPTNGKVKELFPGIQNAAAFSFSPDFRSMCFTRIEEIGTAHRPGSLIVAPLGKSEGVEVATARNPHEPFFAAGPARFSPKGDRLLFIKHLWENVPNAGSLSVVGTDGRGERRLAMAARITSARWDPTERYIAYTAIEDTAQTAPVELHLVELATGNDHKVEIPGLSGRDLYLMDWSSDGRYLGMINGRQFAQSEYWVVQDLEEALK